MINSRIREAIKMAGTEVPMQAAGVSSGITEADDKRTRTGKQRKNPDCLWSRYDGDSRGLMRNGDDVKAGTLESKEKPRPLRVPEAAGAISDGP